MHHSITSINGIHSVTCAICGRTESDIDAEHLREHLAAHGWERDEVTGHYRCQKCADFARAFSGSCASAVSSVSGISRQKSMSSVCSPSPVETARDSSNAAGPLTPNSVN